MQDDRSALELFFGKQMWNVGDGRPSVNSSETNQFTLLNQQCEKLNMLYIQELCTDYKSAIRSTTKKSFNCDLPC